MLALVFTIALTSTAVARTQDSPPPATGRTVTPLKVQVVIARYQGDKKVSSLPYTLSMNATADARNPGHANLRMGAKIPVAAAMFGPPAPQTVTSFNYENVGTNIDCSALMVDDGRFRVDITIDDTSVYPDEQGLGGAVKGTPSFRSFRASDQMVLKDGATAQFTAATDKVSGEVVRVDVTLTVVK